ncbi:MAG: ATP-binding protein [Acidobacteriota bacterium]
MWIFLAALGVLNLPFVWPGWEDPGQLTSVLDLLVISAVVVLLLAGLKDLHSPSERLFWTLTAAGYGCWWLSRAILWIFAHADERLVLHVLVDTLYILLFLFSLAAAELRPDLGRPMPEGWPWRPRLGTAALLLTILSFALYFVVIPSRIDPTFYGTRVSSMKLYAALDLLVAVRFGLLARSARGLRWTSIYGLCALSMGLWFALDASDAYVRVAGIEIANLSPLNILWSVPLVVLGLAASLRRDDVWAGQTAGVHGEEIEARREASPMLAVAILLPLMHSALGACGALEPDFQGFRDAVVVLALLALGGLLIVERGSERSRRQLRREEEKAEARRKLRRSEERFRKLASATFEGVIVHDGTTIIDANEQLAAMFGFSLDEVVGSKIGDRVAQVDKEFVVNTLQAPATGEPLEFRAYRRDRTPFVAEVRGRNLPSLGPDVRVAVVRDLTDYRRLEKDLRQAQKMDAVGRLAGGIAHDFNNLLTVILGSCDLATPETFDEDIRQIRSAALRAAGMTTQLLAFSRQQELQLEIFDINESLRETEPLLRRLLPASISLEVQFNDGVPPVRADRNQMAQVVLNLIINGRDAMPDGGDLSIWLGLESIPAAGDAMVESFVTLNVRDSGNGIDPKDLSQIFDPFFTTKAIGQGTGLGLATVQRIVSQVGGYVEVDSRVGVGTTFRVFLPVSPEGQFMDPESAAPGVMQGWGQGRVLVVDDQPEICAVLTKVLEQAGFEVVSAGSGADALRQSQSWREPPALLIADVVMPELGGPELASRLLARWPEMPVLFTSGYSEGPWFDAIADRPLLAKPFDRQRLSAAVRKVLAPGAHRERSGAHGRLPFPDRADG